MQTSDKSVRRLSRLLLLPHSLKLIRTDWINAGIPISSQLEVAMACIRGLAMSIPARDSQSGVPFQTRFPYQSYTN